MCLMVKIDFLAGLIFGLNALIDRGLSIPLKEVKSLCEEENYGSVRAKVSF